MGLSGSSNACIHYKILQQRRNCTGKRWYMHMFTLQGYGANENHEKVKSMQLHSYLAEKQKDPQNMKLEAIYREQQRQNHLHPCILCV
jgi:hypothetical protein